MKIKQMGGGVGCGSGRVGWGRFGGLGSGEILTEK